MPFLKAQMVRKVKNRVGFCNLATSVLYGSLCKTKIL